MGDLMIEVEKELNISAKDAFDLFSKIIIEDIKSSTGKELNKEEIHSGYSYKKKMKNKLKQSANVEVLLSIYEPNRVYETQYISGDGNYTTRYTVEEIDDKSIKVTYFEEYKANATLSRANSKLIDFFTKRRNKSIAKQRLELIEKTVKGM